MKPHAMLTQIVPNHAVINPELLRILCCPETHQPLGPAPAELVTQINRQIALRKIQQRDLQQVSEPMEEGLVREDGKIFYPIRKGIPILIISQGIPLTSDI